MVKSKAAYRIVMKLICHRLMTNCVTSRKTKTGFNYGVQRNLGKQGNTFHGGCPTSVLSLVPLNAVHCNDVGFLQAR